MCDIDARVLSGMQVTVQAHSCILTVGCKGARSLGCWCRWRFGMLFGVRLGVWGGAVWGALRVTVQAHFLRD